VGQVTPPGATRHALTLLAQHGAGSHRWRWIALLSVLVLLSLVLVQSGKAPNAEMLAANSRRQEIRSTIGSRRRNSMMLLGRQ